MAVKSSGSYKAKVFRVGGSHVLTIPREVREAINLGDGDVVRIQIIDKDVLSITKVRSVWNERIARRP